MSNKTKIEPGTVTPASAEAVDAAVMGQLDAPPATAVAVHRPMALGACDFGDDQSPLSLARVRIAHNLSPNEPPDTPKGAIVLGKDWDVLLCKQGQPVKIIVMGVVKYWKERPDVYDPGQVLRTFRTKEEAKQAGLVVDWGPQGSGVKPNCSPCLDVQMLIQRPEGVSSPLFCCVLGGNEYAPAIATFDKKAFAAAEQLLKIVALRDSQTRKVPLTEANLANFYFVLKTATYETSRKTKVPYFSLALALDAQGCFSVPDEATKSELAKLVASASSIGEAAGGEGIE